jgi:hypothetical protein
VLLVVAPVQLLSVLVTASADPGHFVDPETGEFQSGDLWTWIAGSGVVVVLGLISTTLASGMCFKVIVDA